MQDRATVTLSCAYIRSLAFFLLIRRASQHYIGAVVRQKKHDDILELLREEGAEAARKAQRGLIIQPGAVGDCILTLPLAEFMKDLLDLGGVDMLGHAEYIEFLPGRSCVDRIISIDSLDLHRLFTESKDFDVADRDPLVSSFSGYAWIATFLGEPGGDFEHNLIYTANCSGSAEVVTLAFKPPKGFSGHLASFYKNEFVREAGLSSASEHRSDICLIQAAATDVAKGKAVLDEAGLDLAQRPVVVHPGSGGLEKCWHLDNFLAVAEKLKSEDLGVLFLLGPAELERYSNDAIKQIGDVAPFVSELPLSEVLSVLSCTEAFVGNDSGITHLAAALGVRTFALFGPTDSSLYAPIGPEVTILENEPETFGKKPSVESQEQLFEAILA